MPNGVYKRSERELERLRAMAKRAGELRGKQMERPLGYRMIEKRSGYVMTKTPRGMMYEHRWVMEQSLGRSLLPSEFVHHVNWDKGDNRPDNLVLTSPSTHRHNHRGERHKESSIRKKWAAERPRDRLGRWQ